MFQILLHFFLVSLLTRYILLILQPLTFFQTVSWCFSHPCWPRRDILIMIPNHFFTKVPLLHCTVMAYQILRDPAPYTWQERWLLVVGECFMDLINGGLLYPLRVIWLPDSLYGYIKRQTYERCRVWYTRIAYSEKYTCWAEEMWEAMQRRLDEFDPHR